MHYVTSTFIDELQLTAKYYITIDMCNLKKPFGIKIGTSDGKDEEVKNIYTTATEAFETAMRFSDSKVLPGTARDIIRDEFIGLLI